MTLELSIPSSFQRNAPTDLSTISEFETRSGTQLPTSYKTFLLEANGGAGFIGENAYAILWPIEDLVELNDAYQIDQYARGLLLIGSDGGGEGLALDLRSETMPVVAVPFVGMSLELVEPMAASFATFFEDLSNRRDDDDQG